MSAAPKTFEVVVRGGVPLIYAASDDARRAGLAGVAVARAHAALEAARSLRNTIPGVPDDLATTLLVDRALELVKVAASLLTLDPPDPSGVGGECEADVIFGRVDWLVAERTAGGALVASGELERRS